VNFMSLFSGVGGLDLGLERAGMTCVAQVEIDPFCRRVLAKHWPEVPRHDDVRTCVEWWMGEPRSAVDVVCGGFPCQPVSVAGRRLAQADERWLWPAAWAVIRDLRPAYAILENVPGLLGRGMGDVLGDLAEIGYDAEWDCVPAAAVGAPHRRDRIFVVAYPGRESGRAQPEPEPGRGGEAVAGDDGAVGFVANATGLRRPPRTFGGAAYLPESHPRWRPEPSFCGMADGVSEGLDGGRLGAGPWVAEWPDTPRVAYGVPARVDRLRALGNAVVPQVAEHVGRLVMGAGHVA
jgi:DNA (cytosine-5)-methyltransferase 1